jgi:SAM-dependent methyltransferase
VTDTTAKGAPPSLVERYGPDDLDLLEAGARERFVPEGAPWDEVAPRVAFEILYRKEPELYDRLIAGESIHPDVIAALPTAHRCVEVAAGSGRLTKDLVERCSDVVAIEPARPLRTILRARFPAVDVRPGYFDSTGLPPDSADLVVSCSAFSSDPAHGGDRGLRELERIATPGGTIALVWPADVEWLVERGFTYETFPGDMSVTFASAEEAVEMARIFYPDAVNEIVERGSNEVPYEVLGMNPPRDIAWKRVG